MSKNNLKTRTIQESRKKEQKPKVHNIIKTEADYSNPPRGEPKTKCKKCGKVFEQMLYAEQNRYSNFETCPSCRRKVAIEKNKNLEETEKTVATLPFKPFPWQKQAGEDFEKVRFQIIDAGNRCFTKGVLINGCDKFVEDIKVGDFSFDGKGNKTVVTNVDSKEVSEEFYTIKSLGRLPLEVTKDHLIYVSEKNTENKFFGKYMVAEELYSILENEPNKKLYLSTPMPKSFVDCDYWEYEPLLAPSCHNMKGIELDKETAWLYGLYCAEGCYNSYKHVKITLDIKKEHLQNKASKILEKHGIHAPIYKEPKGGIANVKVFRQQFCRKIDKEIGHGSINKQIPHSILYNKNKEILIEFLKGYYAGDGNMSYSNGVLRCQTISKKLALQLQTAWAILGFNSSLSITDRTKTARKSKNIDYVVIQNEEEAYNLLGYERPKKKYSKKYFVQDETIYTEISKVEKTFKTDTIYLISTDTHELCANCTKNHNCGKGFGAFSTNIERRELKLRQ